MRLVIVEDEPVASEKLAGYLSAAAPRAEIAAKLGSVSEAIRWLAANPAPDLLFCDIQLTDGLSFEIFDAAPVRCPVIFTTAHDEYLLDAFRVNGIEYLLKPIRQSQVAAAIAKYERLAVHFTQDMARRMTAAAKGEAGPRDRFLVRRGASHIVVRLEEVAYFLCENKLVLLVTMDGRRFPFDRTLSDLEAELEPNRFFRANRAALVSIDSVVRCTPHGRGKLALELAPAAEEAVVVSQDRAAACKKWLGG